MLKDRQEVIPNLKQRNEQSENSFTFLVSETFPVKDFPSSL